MNGVPPDMTCSKELQQQVKILDKLILKQHTSKYYVGSTKQQLFSDKSS